ncbi:MAG: RHS repeat protein, partial [Sphingomonadales bacterium]|nr:RHS repeat protein [Sphingomonadales bacterium]
QATYLNDGTLQSSNIVNKFEYDARGNRTKLIEAFGLSEQRTTSYVYDKNNRLIQENRPDSISVSYQYDAKGNVNAVTDAAGKKFYSYYDALDRVILSVDAKGYVTKTEYDDKGQVEKVIRYAQAVNMSGINENNPPSINGLALPAQDYVTSYVYDDLGRVTEEKMLDGTAGANGSSTVYNYDITGNLILVTDPNGNKTFSYYDGLGRVILSVDGAGYVTKTDYNAFGEVASITRYANAIGGVPVTSAAPTIGAANTDIVTDSANDAVTLFEYDRRGLVTKTTDAHSNFETFAYDAAGNRTKAVNKLGHETLYIYDNSGLMTSETKLLKLHDSNGAAVPVTTGYKYDALGNRVEMIEAKGRTEERITHYFYDKNNRLVETRGEARTILDQTNHLTETTGYQPGEFIDYDRRGNIIRTEDAGGAETFFYYDAVGRKTVEINSFGSFTTYSYDFNGNILTTKVYGNVGSVSGYSGGDEANILNLLPATGELRETRFAYDALGRMTESRVKNVETGSWAGSSYVTGQGDLVTQYQYDKMAMWSK